MKLTSKLFSAVSMLVLILTATLNVQASPQQPAQPDKKNIELSLEGFWGKGPVFSSTVVGDYVYFGTGGGVRVYSK